MSEKIFLDLDEEIIFIVEKVKKVGGDKVILIVPERASLLGSSVSLKLLAQEVARSDKIVILVTEDEVGIKLAEKAPLISVSKVNDISEKTWAEASELKAKLMKRRDFEKKTLLEERREQIQKGEEKKEPVEDQQPEEEKEQKQEPVLEEKPETEQVAPKDEKKESPPHELKRLEPQMVNVNGFNMVAGGDIAELRKQDEPKETDEIEDSSTSEKKSEASRSIVGQDMSSMSYSQLASKDKQKKADTLSPLKGVSEKVASVFKQLTKTIGGKSKILIIFLGFIIIFFLVSYFVLPSGSVTLKVESQDIEITKEVIADTLISTLDAENLTVPAKQLEVAKDRSGSATATGKEKTGEKATGSVTLYNLSETQTASIPSGTILESVESGLKYTTVKAVTIEKKRPDDDPELPGLFGTEDVGIVAEDFGKDYNTSDKEEFRVTGFELDVVYGKNFNDITGGSSKEITVISQDDYNALKKSLINELKPDLLQGLKDEAGLDRELLEDTVKYKVINEDPSPGIGAEADTLNLSVTVRATGLSFSREDIDSLAQILVETENDQAVDVEEFKYDSKVKKTEGEKIFIALKITGVVTPRIDTEAIKVQLAGKSLNSANEYLESMSNKNENVLGESTDNNSENSNTGIENFSIELSPTWLPSFLEHFPGSTSKIEIVVEKVSTN